MMKPFFIYCGTINQLKHLNGPASDKYSIYSITFGYCRDKHNFLNLHRAVPVF